MFYPNIHVPVIQRYIVSEATWSSCVFKTWKFGVGATLTVCKERSPKLISALMVKFFHQAPLLCSLSDYLLCQLFILKCIKCYQCILAFISIKAWISAIIFGVSYFSLYRSFTYRSPLNMSSL